MQKALDTYKNEIRVLETSGEYLCFEFSGVSVGLSSDNPSITQWLADYFAGYFILGDNKTPDAVIYSTQNEILFQSLFSKKEDAELFDKKYGHAKLPLDDEHLLIFDGDTDNDPPLDVCYVLSGARRSFLISSTSDVGDHQKLVLDTLRNLTTLLICEKGWIPLHAAAYTRNGLGIAIGGGKAAGKTSTLLNLLSQPGARLVSNDKLFVRDAGAQLEGWGIPTKTGLRAGTILTNPKLEPLIDQVTDRFYEQISREELRAIAATTPTNELPKRKEKIKLIPAELVRALETTVEPVTFIDLFLVVRFDPELEQARLVPMEKEEIFPTFLPLYPKQAKRQKFLYLFFEFAYGDKALEERFTTLMQKYLAQIPVYELHQNERTNEQVVKLVDQLIRTVQEKIA